MMHTQRYYTYTPNSKTHTDAPYGKETMPFSKVIASLLSCDAHKSNVTAKGHQLI